MSSNSDYPSVYITSTHREDTIYTGSPLPPPCQPSWEFQDPSVQTGYHTYDTQSTEYSMGYGAEVAGQHLEPYPQSYSGAAYPQHSKVLMGSASTDILEIGSRMVCDTYLVRLSHGECSPPAA